MVYAIIQLSKKTSYLDVIAFSLLSAAIMTYVPFTIFMSGYRHRSANLWVLFQTLFEAQRYNFDTSFLIFDY